MFPCISLFTALLLAQTGSAEPFPFFEPVKPPRPVQVMVHRGANRYAPENTLPAIALAVELGAVDAAWPSLSKDFIAACHEKGILVFSDALGSNESIEKYRQAIEWGIDVIQTDHPARVLRAVELIESK